MAISGKRLQLSLAITGAVAWILQGYDQALMNGLLTLPSFASQFPSIDTSTPALREKHSTLQGTAVALYEVGAAVGALGCFVIGDWYGRKKTTFGAAIVVLIGVILQATSFELAQLIVARIVTGLGVGSFTATIPSWVGESSEADHRGWLVSLYVWNAELLFRHTFQCFVSCSRLNLHFPATSISQETPRCSKRSTFIGLEIG